MKPSLIIGAACLALAGAPAFAQTDRDSNTTVDPNTGATTTTTTTVHKDHGGAATGALGGAAAGAVVAGPVGAVVGAAAGAVIGHNVAPPERVRTYVTTTTPGPAVAYNGDVAVGRHFDGDVAWSPVPEEPKYSWAYINGRRVVIDNDSHNVAAVY
jgi:hypothetical protein